MRTAFIISGFNMNTSAADEKYKEIREAVAGKGYYVVPVPIHWNNTTVSEYVKKFVDFYNDNKGEHNTVIGNSFGAMVAFLAAPIVQPDRVLVCSLSAYFKEDMPKQQQSYMLRRFGKRRTADSHIISADDIAKALNKTNVEMIFMHGERENWGRFLKLVERVEASAAAVNNSKLVVVPDAPHPFRNPAYIKGIVKEL